MKRFGYFDRGLIIASTLALFTASLVSVFFIKTEYILRFVIFFSASLIGISHLLTGLSKYKPSYSRVSGILGLISAYLVFYFVYASVRGSEYEELGPFFGLIFIAPVLIIFTVITLLSCWDNRMKAKYTNNINPQNDTSDKDFFKSFLISIIFTVFMIVIVNTVSDLLGESVPYLEMVGIGLFVTYPVLLIIVLVIVRTFFFFRRKKNKV